MPQDAPVDLSKRPQARCPDPMLSTLRGELGRGQLAGCDLDRGPCGRWRQMDVSRGWQRGLHLSGNRLRSTAHQGQNRSVERVIITGGPRTGKSTFATALAARTGLPLRRTDDLIASLDWERQIEQVATWLASPGPWIIEGCTCVRALRAWLDRYPGRSPASTIYWLELPMCARTKGQETQAKGCATVWRNDVLPFLHGVAVRTATD